MQRTRAPTGRLPRALTLRADGAVAAAGGAVGGAWAAAAGVPAAFLPASIVFAALLGLLAVADVRTLRLPDALTGALAVAGLAMALTLLPPAAIGAHLLGGCIGLAGAFVFLRLSRALAGRDMIGGGDVKLIAATALWLGWQALPGLLLLATAGGLGLALAGDPRRPLPFGAAIAASAWLLWLYGVPVA